MHFSLIWLVLIYFIQEYEELTEKLNQLQSREQKLRDEMSNGHATPSSSSPKSDHEVFEPALMEAPKSPNLQPVRAYLPNKQRTSVCMNTNGA